MPETELSDGPAGREGSEQGGSAPMPARAPSSLSRPTSAAPRDASAWRAPAVGLFLVAVLCVVTLYSDLVLQGSWIAHNSLPIGALTLFLLLVTGGNRAALRCRPGWALTRAETLEVYAMLLVASGIPSVGFTLPALSVAVAPGYYHSAEDAINSTTAGWLRVHDPEAIRQYFHGLDAGVALPWRAWWPPLIAWSLFAVLLYTAFLCMSVLLRRAWVEEERLSYPLIQVPLEITGPAARPTGNRAFFRNPLTWLGIAVPAILHTLNALQSYWPAIPDVLATPTRLGEMLVARPWNALSDLRAFIYFSVVGLTYLLPSDVSLSLWFFFLVSRIEAVAFAALGFDDRTAAEAVGFSPSWFVTTQMWGALLFFGALLLVEGLRSAGRDLRRREKGGDREGAALLRMAFFGLAGSVALLGFWARAAGGQLTVQLEGLLLWMLAILALTRLVCAGGLLLIDTNYLPRDILYRVLGARVVRPGDLAVLTYHNTVFAYYPQLTMLPFLFNSVKLGDEAGLRPGRLLSGMAAAMMLAIPLSFGVALLLIYHRGAVTLSQFHLGGMARQNFDELAGYLASPSSPRLHTLLSLALGAGVMAALIALQRSVLWWPFSPLGYLVGSSWTVMHHLWFCVLLGWLANGLVRRYGGLNGFVRFRPFFLGLVLGEFLTAAVWMGIDACLGVRGHNIFPGPG